MTESDTRPSHQLPTAVRDLLARQDGLVTRAQLQEHKVTKATIAWNAGRQWAVPLRMVYAPGHPELTLRRRQIAALLFAGPGTSITGLAAAELHGLRSAGPVTRIDVLTSPNRARRKDAFVVVRPTTLVDTETVTRGPIRFVSAARACVDAACELRSNTARSSLFIEAVQKKTCSVDDLAEWLHRLRTRDVAGLARALDDAASGAWSLPEARLLDLMSTSSVLPDVWPNASLSDELDLPLLTPDAWFDDVGMAVLVHSRQFHSDPEQWNTTVSKDGNLVSAGIIVAGVTPNQIDREPREVLARLERTYRAAQRRARPPVQASRLPGWRLVG